MHLNAIEERLNNRRRKILEWRTPAEVFHDAPTQFFRPAGVLEKALVERWLKDGPWPWTDDSAMALSLLRILDRHGRVDQDALAAEFARA